jgi:hypothetical protein
MPSPLILALLASFMATHSLFGDIWPKPIETFDHSINYMEPPTLEHPTNVSVGLFLQDLREINESHESYRAIGYLYVEWNDPRLTYSSEKTGFSKKSYGQFSSEDVLKIIWWPSLMITNALEHPNAEKLRISIYPDGTIVLQKIFDTVLFSPFDLRKFPFDSQELLFNIQSYYSEEIVNLANSEAHTAWNPQLEIPGWKIQNLQETTQTKSYAWNDKEFKNLSIRFEIKRDAWFFIWRLVLPLVLMVIMTWSIFWMDGEKLNDRIKVCSYGFLTSVTFSLAVSTILPRISYLTFLDKVLIGTYIYVMLAALQSAIQHIIKNSGREQLALKIDYWCRPIFPLSYVVLWIILAQTSL